MSFLGSNSAMFSVTRVPKRVKGNISSSKRAVNVVLGVVLRVGFITVHNYYDFLNVTYSGLKI